MIEHDIFPTKMFEVKANKDVCYSILDEIVSNENRLKLVSLSSQKQSVEDYVTDYDDPIKLPQFESVIQNMKFDGGELTLNRYWVASYKNNAFHHMHIHKGYCMDKCNWSGILYLSDIGFTEFFSTNPTSFFNMSRVKSEFGKIIMFPSNLPHSFTSDPMTHNKRYIVAFNFELYGNE